MDREPYEPRPCLPTSLCCSGLCIAWGSPSVCWKKKGRERGHKGGRKERRKERRQGGREGGRDAAMEQYPVLNRQLCEAEAAESVAERLLVGTERSGGGGPGAGAGQ